MGKEKEKQKLQKLVEAMVRKELLILFEQEWAPMQQSIFGKVFIEPFTDVAKTAIYGIKKNAASLLSNVMKLAKQAGVAFLPFAASSEIDRIGKEEEEALKTRLGELDAKYADVLQRNWDTMRTRDIAALGFVLNPAVAIGTGVVKRTPQIALDMLHIFTNGDPKIGPIVEKYRNAFAELNKKVLPPGAGTTGYNSYAGGMDYGGEGMGESIKYTKNKKKKIILEQQPTQAGYTQKQLFQKAVGDVGKFLQRSDVQKAMQDSPIIQTLRNTAINVILERAKKVAGFKNYEDFKKYMGNTEFSKFENQTIPKDTTPEQMEELKKALIPEFKKSYKKIFTQQLQVIAKQAPGSSDEINGAIGKLDILG